MNFYKHYIGDFQRDTSHLSLTEKGAYLALIQHYYATEKPLPNDVGSLCRIAGAFSKSERAAVKVATSFFEVKDGMLWHKRIEAELEKQEHRNDTNRRIALEREARKREESLAPERPRSEHETCSERPRSDHVQSTNQNQNQNHTSSLRSEDKRKRSVAKPVDVTDEVWASFLQVRKTKKAAVTELAILGIRREAVKAGVSLNQALTVCCERGWASFKADWDWQDKGRAKATANSALFASMTHLHTQQQEEHHGRTIDATPRLG